MQNLPEKKVNFFLDCLIILFFHLSAEKGIDNMNINLKFDGPKKPVVVFFFFIWRAKCAVRNL